MIKESTRRQVKLCLVVALTGTLFGAELVASQVTKSFVLLADAYHTLYNLMSLLLLVIGNRISKTRTLKNTFGWARVEVLGILFNVLFLCALYFALTMGSILHLLHASHDPIRPLYPLLILTFGLLGLLANFLCFILIGGYSHHQECYLSIEGGEVHLGYVVGEKQSSVCDARGDASITAGSTDSRIEISPRLSESEGAPGLTEVGTRSRYHRLLGLVRDASSCLLVVLCACAVQFLQEPLGGALADYADVVGSLFGIGLQIATTYPFLKETGMILLQTIPPNIDIESIKRELIKKFQPEILNVHDLHVWKLSKSQVIATCHVIVSSPSAFRSLAPRLQRFFIKRDITLATVQPEFPRARSQSTNIPDVISDCILPCSVNCSEPNCCRSQPQEENPGVRRRHSHSHGRSHSHHGHSHLEDEDIAAGLKEENDLDTDLLVKGGFDYSKLKDLAETRL